MTAHAAVRSALIAVQIRGIVVESQSTGFVSIRGIRGIVVLSTRSALPAHTSIPRRFPKLVRTVAIGSLGASCSTT